MEKTKNNMEYSTEIIDIKETDKGTEYHIKQYDNPEQKLIVTTDDEGRIVRNKLSISNDKVQAEVKVGRNKYKSTDGERTCEYSRTKFKDATTDEVLSIEKGKDKNKETMKFTVEIDGDGNVTETREIKKPGQQHYRAEAKYNVEDTNNINYMISIRVVDESVSGTISLVNGKLQSRISLNKIKNIGNLINQIQQDPEKCFAMDELYAVEGNTGAILENPMDLLNIADSNRLTSTTMVKKMAETLLLMSEDEEKIEMNQGNMSRTNRTPPKRVDRQEVVSRVVPEISEEMEDGMSM
ncbi:MAG TPA: hypothetical protein DEG71_06850 [Clostridiales bacterium]|nr:hypothetical protein [Clostridiales bacterium]